MTAEAIEIDPRVYPYTDALGIGLAVAALLAVAGAGVVKRRLPARHAPDLPAVPAVAVSARAG